MSEELTITDTEAKIEVDVAAISLEKELNEKYNEDFIKLLKRVSYEISIVGLPIIEACMYVGMDYEKFTALMEKDPLIMRLIQTKELEYKRGLIKVVSEKAKTDEKTSLGLLQARFPDEFNPRKGKPPGGDSEDMIAVAMEFIQKSGDNTPLVTEKSGKAFIIKHNTSAHADTMKKISDMLN